MDDYPYLTVPGRIDLPSTSQAQPRLTRPTCLDGPGRLWSSRHALPLRAIPWLSSPAPTSLAASVSPLAQPTSQTSPTAAHPCSTSHACPRHVRCSPSRNDRSSQRRAMPPLDRLANVASRSSLPMTTDRTPTLPLPPDWSRTASCPSPVCPGPVCPGLSDRSTLITPCPTGTDLPHSALVRPTRADVPHHPMSTRT